MLAVKTYVDTHLAEQPDAAQIARMANMSYGYFSRCFHDIVGRSFSDYCIDLRIAHARKLLETTGSSIQQIAADVGYGDEKYFSRLFRKTCGVSPSEYRRAQGRQT